MRNPPVDYHQELDTARSFATAAALTCKRIQGELVGSAQKAGREPVTIADYASQALIGKALAESFPDDAVLSEERAADYMTLLPEPQRALVRRFVTEAVGSAVSDEQICEWLDTGKQTSAPRTWTVDPIDGTAGFLGNRHYCVAVSLMVDFTPVVGVLASPGFYREAERPPQGGPGALTYAVQGRGAFIQPLTGGQATPLRVSVTSDPSRAVILTSHEDRHVDLGFIERLMQALKRGPDAPYLRLDSQDKHAMLASGQGDINLRVSNESSYREKVWDHAAGHVIVTEADGRTSDAQGRPLDFSLGTRLSDNQGILMTNGPLHQPLLDAIQRSL